MTKLSDFIADFIADLGIRHVFGVSGGGAMHLIDSIGKHERVAYVPTHHEQAAAMAAECYSRVAGIGCALVTTGPGGTNAITGVACAWVDSIPVLYISGQVTQDTLLEGHGIRQFGVQETDIVSLVKPITKYSVCVKDPADIRYELEKAVHIARSGRPGPVWVDIPLDVQSKQVDPSQLRGLNFAALGNIAAYVPSELDVFKCISMLKAAKRPVLIIGYGVRLAGADHVMRILVDRLGIPVISSWTASDMLETPYHVGHFGIFGDRAGNFTVQNADLLLVIGCRMSVPQIGHVFKNFAPRAKMIMVDVDKAEIDKPSLHVDLGIVADAKWFINELNSNLGVFDAPKDWLEKCQEWQRRYPVVLPEYAKGDRINSFYFIDELAKRLPSDAIVVLDQGTAFTCSMQTFKIKLGQRLIHSGGHSAMGYGLPGAIGAHFASGKKVICIVGDGALQMNIQELQTIRHHNLPIIIFVLNNDGYLTIKHMQDNHFQRRVGSDPASGVSCPDVMAIAGAYDIPAICMLNRRRLDDDLQLVLTRCSPFNSPFICEIVMDADQPLIPRMQSIKLPDGSITSGTLEDLYPFLPREELEANMIRDIPYGQPGGDGP